MKIPPRHILLPLAALALGLILLAGGVALRFGADTPAASGIGGPFTLTDTNGKTVTDAAFKGEPTLVFFGYTHCPDICPTTLASLSQVLAALGPDKKAAALFITLDPERDTPAVLKDYLLSFDPRIVGLTGSPAAIGAVEGEYRVYSKKVPTQGGDYSMDHTGLVYLMDKTGNFVESFNADLDHPAAAASTLAKYL
jgi:protein SCO1/2